MTYFADEHICISRDQTEACCEKSLVGSSPLVLTSALSTTDKVSFYHSSRDAKNDKWGATSPFLNFLHCVQWLCDGSLYFLLGSSPKSSSLAQEADMKVHSGLLGTLIRHRNLLLNHKTSDKETTQQREHSLGDATSRTYRARTPFTAAPSCRRFV